MIKYFLLEQRQLGLNDNLFRFVQFNLSFFIQLSVKVNDTELPFTIL